MISLPSEMHRNNSAYRTIFKTRNQITSNMDMIDDVYMYCYRLRLETRAFFDSCIKIERQQCNLDTRACRHS